MIDHEDRCVGALLGCACGDALGLPWEDWFKTRTKDFCDGRFSGGTEMTLALAMSLIERQTADSEHCAKTYADFFVSEPRRGYGPAAAKALEMICSGTPGIYKKTGTLTFKEGSYGNGGAMRIAPVGLAFRNAYPHIIHRAVIAALLCTHVHPDAIDGAILQARIVGAMAKANTFKREYVGEWLQTLEKQTMRDRPLAAALGTLHRAFADRLSDEDFLNLVCEKNDSGRIFQIHTAEAVVCALWAFAHHVDDPEAAVIRAVNLGGDTDAIGAMTGALCGALHGAAWIPKRWFDNLENAPGVGRDFIIETAKQLAKLDLRTV